MWEMRTCNNLDTASFHERIVGDVTVLHLGLQPSEEEMGSKDEHVMTCWQAATAKESVGRPTELSARKGAERALFPQEGFLGLTSRVSGRRQRAPEQYAELACQVPLP